jgi:transposase
MAKPRGNMQGVRDNLNSNVKISLDRVNKICSALQAGAPIQTAAAFAGVSAKTIYNWIAKAGEVMERLEKAGPDAILSPDDQLYMKFVEGFQSALASFELKNLALIAHAAMGGPDGKGTKYWQAAAWLLERRKPQSYGMNRQVTDDENPTGEKDVTPEEVQKQELDVYDPERIARLYRGYQECGLIPQETLTRILTEGVPKRTPK